MTSIVRAYIHTHTTVSVMDVKRGARVFINIDDMHQPGLPTYAVCMYKKRRNQRRLPCHHLRVYLHQIWCMLYDTMIPPTGSSSYRYLAASSRSHGYFGSMIIYLLETVAASIGAVVCGTGMLQGSFVF